MSASPALIAAVAALLGVLVFLNGLVILRSGRSIFGFRVGPMLEGSPFTQRTAGLFMMVVGPLAAIMISGILLWGPRDD